MSNEKRVIVQSILYAAEYESELNQTIARLNEQLKDATSENDRVSFLDVNAIISPSYTYTRDEHLSDNIHLSSEGYRGWSTAIRAALLPKSN